MKKYPNFLKSLFHLTVNDEKIPTDVELDRMMENISFMMHHIWPQLWYILKKKVWLFFRYKWRNWLVKLSVISVILFLSYIAWIKVAKPIFIVREKLEFVTQAHKELLDSPIPKGNLLFMTSLSIYESGNNYSVSNGQYWGSFQIGDLGRQELHMENFPKEEFLKDTVLQNWAMNKLMKKNYEYLRSYIQKLKIPKKGGIKIGGSIVTVSGILAGSHLVGPSAAIKFLESNGQIVPKDGNGVPITRYFEFNNIELELE